MKITEETISYVAALAKLELKETEIEKTKEDLEKILEYINTMNELDTEQISPMSHTFDLCNVFRDDVVTNEEVRDDLLVNAPKKKEGSFMVPKTVE